MLIALAAVLVCAVGGYALGQRKPVLLSTQARCDLGTRSISCQPVDDDGSPDHDGWTYSVPVDVAWSGSGYAHDGGRPECLPPMGGLSDVFGLSWVEVTVDGRDAASGRLGDVLTSEVPSPLERRSCGRPLPP